MDSSVLSPATLKGKLKSFSHATRLLCSWESRDGWGDRNLIGEVGTRDKVLNNGV